MNSNLYSVGLSKCLAINVHHKGSAFVIFTGISTSHSDKLASIGSNQGILESSSILLLTDTLELFSLTHNTFTKNQLQAF
jgi:hypothetical protein